MPIKSIDSVRINFDGDSLFLLNICLALIMFGIALDLKLEDFKRVLLNPKAVIVGLCSQFIVLPFLTFLLVLIFQPQASMALGLFLIAACPGGNISNFFSKNSKADVALSISITAVASVLCIVFTPLNFLFYSSLYGPSNEILREVDVSPYLIFETIILILGLPLLLGMLCRHYYEKISIFLSKILKNLSMLIFVGFVLIALLNNLDIFYEYVQYIILLVALHNGIALFSGYQLAKLFKLKPAIRRSISIETGIQNSGLGLVLIFSYFDGLGGMAIIAAWWGIWHIISGMSISSFWRLRNKNVSLA